MSNTVQQPGADTQVLPGHMPFSSSQCFGEPDRTAGQDRPNGLRALGGGVLKRLWVSEGKEGYVLPWELETFKKELGRVSWVFEGYAET